MSVSLAGVFLHILFPNTNFLLSLTLSHTFSPSLSLLLSLSRSLSLVRALSLPLNVSLSLVCCILGSNGMESLLW